MQEALHASALSISVHVNPAGKAVRMLFGDGWLERRGKGGKLDPFTWEVCVLAHGIIVLRMGYSCSKNSACNVAKVGYE